MKIKSELKKQKYLASLVLIVFAVFFIAFPTHATGGNFATWLISGIAQVFVSVLGWILSFVIGILVYIAQYNKFIDSNVVVVGWVIIRDICNMFFVIVLLIIAFATILKLENYSYKKWLPKLILMAILINFSKMICGLMIDAAQIIMLTFVNAFKDIGGGNMVNLLGIQDWQSLKGIEEVSSWEITAAYVLSVIYAAVALIVVVAMLAMLVMRIIMLWIYVVLSPLAYLMSAFPGGSKYASSWWSEFTKNLIVGPVLAFFIWLSFTSLANFQTNSLEIAGTPDNRDQISCELDTNGVCKYGTSDILLKFIIAIGMLLGGLKITSEIGGEAAKVAGKVAESGKKVAYSTGKWMGRQLGDARDIASEKLGVDLNFVAAEKRRREQIEYNRQLRKTRVRKNTLTQAEEGKTWFGRKAALLSTGDVAWQNIMDGKFNAGNPKLVTDKLAEIEKEKDKKTAAEDAIKDLDLQSARVVTANEARQNRQRIQEINANNTLLENTKIGAMVGMADLETKEKKRILTTAEATELAKKRSIISDSDDALRKNQEEKETLNNKNVVVANQTEKDARIADYTKEKAARTKTIADADAEIRKFTEILRKNQLSEVQSARADINAKLESEANKKIANFSNPDQLVGIYKEAEEQHDEGLMSVCYKKLAKTGNYNELHRELGLGTGYDGMIAMSKRLQDNGGMTEQDSMALIAEVGELAKSVNHFEAYGAMSMNKAGRWEESGKDNQEAAILAEKSKIQVQQFVRSANRLGNGSYRNGEPHDAEHWDLSRSSIALFASKDKAYRDDIEKTGNINFIQFIGANERNLKALEAAGAVQVAQVIRDICAKAKNNAGSPNVSNPLKTIQNTVV